MKRDELEKAILAQRKQLDRVEPVPADRIWASVERKLPGGNAPKGGDWQIGRNWRRLLLVASLALLTGLGLWLFLPEAEPASVRLASVYPELAPREEAYLHLIAQREAAIDFNQVDRETYREIREELKTLEEARAVAWKDLEVQPEKEELIAILMRYYEKKLLILDRLQKELDRQKMQKQRDEHISL